MEPILEAQRLTEAIGDLTDQLGEALSRAIDDQAPLAVYDQIGLARGRRLRILEELDPLALALADAAKAR
jgi:hypothetical protein